MGGFSGTLYLAVTCSIWFLLEVYSRIRRIQRFLVRQWIHVAASLRVLGGIFSVYSAMLVLSGHMLCVSHGACVVDFPVVV